MKPKCAILRDPGTNCHRESRAAAELVGFAVYDVFIKELLEGRKDINDYHFIIDAGGFGNGDYIRAGAIKGARMRKVGGQFEEFYDNGKLMLMICNGAQDGVQSGLISSRNGPIGEQDITLYKNKCGNFRNQPVYLQNVNKSKCAFTKGLSKTVCFPMRNGEGRFIPKDEKVLKRLYDDDQVVFKYVTPDGSAPVLEKDQKLFNPTGSVDRIAGVCNKRGNWLALMPHPECAIDPFTDWRWTGERGPKNEGDGVIIFRNAYEYVKGVLL
jgi:phosphoribosylformylglycinamidine synthase